MAGYNWIRFTADKSDGTKDNEGIAINMDIYDASKGTGDDWIFIGDSITQMAMNHNTFENPLGKGTFAELINNRNKKYFPAQENGGTGYMTSADGAKHIEKWLAIFPGKFVGLSYGTNDAWNCMDPKEFYNNYEIMVKAVLKAGKVPLIPRSIPWSSSQEKIRACGAGLDAEIQKLFKAYPAIIVGPDFREYYRKNPKMISQDGVHPSWPDGLFMYRKMWADTAIKNVYGN
jgi:lysophospholipase L1-like esterase